VISFTPAVLATSAVVCKLCGGGRSRYNRNTDPDAAWIGGSSVPFPREPLNVGANVGAKSALDEGRSRRSRGT
jgi:hypothetical protein